MPSSCELWSETSATGWRTEAHQATQTAEGIATQVASMNAKVEAFKKIIYQLGKACDSASSLYASAEARLNRDWSETVRIMDLPKMEVRSENFWDQWAKDRVASTRVVTSKAVERASSEVAQAAAATEVAAMQASVRAEAEALYTKMQAENKDLPQVEINLDTNFGSTNFEGSWWAAWAKAQTSARREAAAKAKAETAAALAAATAKAKLEEEQRLAALY